jgi:hypothetical protein
MFPAEGIVWLGAHIIGVPPFINRSKAALTCVVPGSFLFLTGCTQTAHSWTWVVGFEGAMEAALLCAYQPLTTHAGL